jgi:hypothetical protein
MPEKMAVVHTIAGAALSTAIMESVLQYWYVLTSCLGRKHPMGTNA